MKTKLFILFFVLAVFTYAQQNTWQQLSDYGGGARSLATGFSIGSKGYILTGGSSSSVTNDLWEYDTLTNVWTQKADFPGNARETAVSFSIGAKGYIGTGMDWGGNKFNDFWEYNSLTDTWTQKANFGGTGRYSAVGFSIGDKGYIGTGHDGNKKNDLWEYDTLANTWTQKTSLPGQARYGAFGFSIGNKGYIGGGSIATGYSHDFWEYDPGTNTWTQKADVVLTYLDYPTGFSIGNYGFVHKYDANNFAQYDPLSDTWRMVESLTPQRNQAVGFSIGNKGYIGTGYNGSRLSDFWRYTPCDNFLIAEITASGPTTFCEGDSVVLTASPGDSYMWWNSDTTQSITVTNSGIFAVQITDECGTVSSDPIEITVLNTPDEPVITQFDSLLTSSATSDNQWYFNGVILPGETGQTCVATYTGNYSVVVTDPSGCSNSATYTYTGNPNFQSVPICLVTVDSSSLYNIIVWDKTLVLNVDTFIVLREISTNNYQPIVKLPYTSLSQFVDTVSYLYFPNTGDPNTGTYRYKMQCIDIYGNHSLLSPYHNTIYFINNGGIFTWLQPYEIENGANPVASYVLMRDDSTNGNWHDVGSVSGTQNFITDPQYSTYLNTASWRVKTTWSISCTASAKSETYNTSYSNVYKYDVTGVDENSKIRDLVIYPNPSSGMIFLNSSAGIKNVELLGLPGEKLFSSQFKGQKSLEIDLSEYPTGMYFIKVTTTSGNSTHKIMLK